MNYKTSIFKFYSEFFQVYTKYKGTVWLKTPAIWQLQAGRRIHQSQSRSPGSLDGAPEPMDRGAVRSPQVMPITAIRPS